MNLLENHRGAILQAQEDIFDTFKRASLVTFYKVSEEEIIMLDPDYNSDLQEYTSVNRNLIEVSQSFECRIIFPKREGNYQTSIPNLSAPIKAEQDSTN